MSDDRIGCEVMFLGLKFVEEFGVSIDEYSSVYVGAICCLFEEVEGSSGIVLVELVLLPEFIPEIHSDSGSATPHM